MNLDAAEAITNAAIGVAVSIGAVRLLWPLFGWEATTGQSVGVTVLFFGLSAARSFVIRRAFRWLEQ